jgi:hypothetical protein
MRTVIIGELQPHRLNDFRELDLIYAPPPSA